MTSLKDKITSRIRKDESGCWVWTGNLTSGGYGDIKIGSRTDNTRRSVRAHRLAYELFVGPIPPGMCVCHSCDNRQCVNPSHLFLGTLQDNADDRDRKGRNRPPPYGESNGQSKLTENDVMEIRAAVGLTNIALARRFGVGRKAILDVRHNTTWRHLLPQPAEEP